VTEHELRLRQAGNKIETNEGVLDWNLAQLDLTVHTTHLIECLGIDTVSDLVSFTADQLLGIGLPKMSDGYAVKYLGMSSLLEVRDKLWTYGLKLRGD